MNSIKLNKKQIRVISAVTFGNILEWFEIYSYAYLVPFLSKLFFNFNSSIANWMSAFIVFGAGFIARPIGAIIFGRIGDLIGRKQAFISSILVMTIPTFLMGFLPTYATIGIAAPILLFLLRFLQSIPAAGEAPGTACFLYENATPGHKRFITSWGGVGNQLGAILGLAVTFFMDNYLDEQFLLSWGWRISFWFGGLIGLLGIYLRKKLHETPVFLELEKKHKLDKETINEVITRHKKKIILGTGFGVVNAATFYLIATYISTYFDHMIGLSENGNFLISLTILILTTIFLPFFGIMGDKYNNKRILIICVILIIILLYPLYVSINSQNFVLLAFIGLLYLIPITCITALYPYIIANLYPTPLRFTGIGLSFNLADGIIGGFTPALSLLLLGITANKAGFIWYILICAIISLISYIKMKD